MADVKTDSEIPGQSKEADKGNATRRPYVVQLEKRYFKRKPGDPIPNPELIPPWEGESMW